MAGFTRDDLRRFIRNCNPDEPLSGEDDARYVRFDEGTPVRGSESRSCIDALFAVIDESEDGGDSSGAASTCQLFSGFSGSGKTTELNRLRQHLEASDVPTHPIYVDFEQYVDRYVPISIADVLRVLAYALDREATLCEGGDPDRTAGYLDRFWDYVRNTDVELKKIEFGFYGAKLPFELRDNAPFRQRIARALADRFQQFADDAKQAMVEAVIRIKRAKRVRRVVVLADSLEKLTATREEDREAVERSVENLFVQQAHHLRMPCHVVYTFPFWLRFRSAEMGGRFDGEPQILPMVKIAHRDGTASDDGIFRLCELLKKRLDLEAVFGEDIGETLLPLVRASGGYPRDLLRMTRNLLRAATIFPVQRRAVEQVIDRLAEQYNFVVRGPDLPLLAEIHRTHALPIGDLGSAAAFARLVERYLVLAYRNGREWYAIHPLVWRGIDERMRALSDVKAALPEPASGALPSAVAIAGEDLAKPTDLAGKDTP